MEVQASGWDGFSLPSSWSHPKLQVQDLPVLWGDSSPFPPVSPLPSQRMNTSGPVGDVRFLAASALWGHDTYCIHLTDSTHMLMRIIC